MNYLPRPDAVLLNGSENTAQTQNQSQGHRRKNKNLESLTKYISMQGKNHTFAPYVTQIRQYDIRNAILLCNKIPKPQFIKPFSPPEATTGCFSFHMAVLEEKKLKKLPNIV